MPIDKSAIPAAIPNPQLSPASVICCVAYYQDALTHTGLPESGSKSVKPATTSTSRGQIDEKTLLAADAGQGIDVANVARPSSTVCSECSQVTSIPRLLPRDCAQHRPTLVDQKNQPCRCEKRHSPKNSGPTIFCFEPSRLMRNATVTSKVLSWPNLNAQIQQSVSPGCDQNFGEHKLDRTNTISIVS